MTNKEAREAAKVAAEQYLDRLIPMIRAAERDDELAGQADAPAIELIALERAFREAARRARARRQSHDHTWNEDDYCSVCGADGRA